MDKKLYKNLCKEYLTIPFLVFLGGESLCESAADLFELSKEIHLL
jgi:hypothetical protein